MANVKQSCFIHGDYDGSADCPLCSAPSREHLVRCAARRGVLVVELDAEAVAALLWERTGRIADRSARRLDATDHVLRCAAKQLDAYEENPR